MNITAVTGEVELNGGYSKLYGFSIETAENVEFSFRNGESGIAAVFISLGADESIQQRFKTPIVLTDGLFLECSGTIEGTVWWTPYRYTEGEVLYPIRDDTRGAIAPE
jgi:hypothetical protein